MRNERFDRQIRLFGAEGQRRIGSASVAIVGVGGLGSHVVQQLAFLGVGRLALVERDELDATSKNRHVCSRSDDPVPGTKKNAIAARMVEQINPSIEVMCIDDDLCSRAGFAAVLGADVVMGCVDNEGARLILTELCAAYKRPYIDLASDVVDGNPPQFGGRVACAIGGDGCLVCMNQLDVLEAAEDLESPNLRRNRLAAYGVDHEVLSRSGPSVVSINGVVASLGVTEAMKLLTGLADPQRLVRYNGNWGLLNAVIDDLRAGCYYCKRVYGSGDAADVERYLPRSDLAA